MESSANGVSGSFCSFLAEYSEIFAQGGRVQAFVHDVFRQPVVQNIYGLPRQEEFCG